MKAPRRGSGAVFGALEARYRAFATARYAILPAPYDGTSTWIKGADRGPTALLEASAVLERYDIETDSEVYRRGIHTAAPVAVDGPPERVIARLEKRVGQLMDAGKYVVTIGGEHSVSVGPIRAHAARVPDLSVLQLDAHTDLRPAFRGSAYNHGCVMARARELCPLVQVGIRSLDAQERAYWDPDRVFLAEKIHGRSAWVERAIRRLTRNVYLTIDLDVFDPSIMPSTGTPEPGGLSWYGVLSFLRRVFRQRNVVGFDIVELCPSPHDKAPDFLAAKLLYKLLSYHGGGARGR